MYGSCINNEDIVFIFGNNNINGINLRAPEYRKVGRLPIIWFLINLIEMRNNDYRMEI